MLDKRLSESVVIAKHHFLIHQFCKSSLLYWLLLNWNIPSVHLAVFYAVVTWESVDTSGYWNFWFSLKEGIDERKRGIDKRMQTQQFK